MKELVKTLVLATAVYTAAHIAANKTTDILVTKFVK